MRSAQAVRDSKMTTLNAIYPPCAESEARNSAVGWHLERTNKRYLGSFRARMVRTPALHRVSVTPRGVRDR